MEDAGGGTDGITIDSSIDFTIQSTQRRSVSVPSDSIQSSLAPRKHVSDLNGTLKRDTEIQTQITERLRLTQKHEMEMKRMELQARAAEMAHERWMKECELGLHHKNVGEAFSQAIGMRVARLKPRALKELKEI